MTQDPKILSLARTVAAGEALHRDLQEHQSAAEGALRDSVTVELIMFYGQAFRHVGEAIEKPIRPGSFSDVLLQEVGEGELLFNIWLETTTPLDAYIYCQRLGERWGRIVGRVIKGLA